MCQLLGMNCNTPTDSRFSFSGFSQRAGNTGDHTDGWGIAFFEYMLQVPGNRIGATQFNVGQLKIMQEVITLLVFVPFSVWFLDQPLKLDYLWAGLCLLGAVYFVFRGAA